LHKIFRCYAMQQDTNIVTKIIDNAVGIIKTAILKSQLNAAKAVNQEQLALYYGIGRYVSQNTRKGVWGQGALKSISEKLQKELPGLKGFSEANLRKMRTFYEEWCSLDSNSFVPTNELLPSDEKTAVETAKTTNGAVSFVPTNEIQDEIILPTRFSIPSDFPFSEFVNIGFTLHYAIVSKVKGLDQRKFYIQLAAESKLRVEDLEKAIAADLYSHRGKLPNNFQNTIPDALQAYRTMQMFKDSYMLDFINVEELFIRDKDRDEKFVENEIVHNVKNFIMTFGKDFTFVGNQYHLEKYGRVEFPDLLFFNRELNALVVVELKDTDFKTAYLGQLCGYLKILDDEVKKPHENPSIGIVLCKSTNQKFAEYVIQDYTRPMGVATYKTSDDMEDWMKRVLPSKEELQKLL